MQDYFKIKGGGKLCGRHEVRGAKNAVLPLIAAGLLTDEDVIVENCPYISDVDAMIDLVHALGARCTRVGRRVVVHGKPTRACAGEEFFKSMRSSMFMLGVLLSTLGEVQMPLPGGCAIGARPMDIHLEGLKRMDAKIETCDGKIKCSCNRLVGNKIFMKYPSVGATENLMICAVLAKGKTTLVNCAKEPEICSLANLLRTMGARIQGDGTSVVEIDGVDKLGGGVIYPVGDRIVAGTIACATALCGGEVEIDGVDKNHLGALWHILQSKNCRISGDDCHVRIFSNGRVGAFDCITAPYPLFPTDLQAPMVTLACFCDGNCAIKETVFENRFAQALELKKLGAKIEIDKNVAYVSGCLNQQSPYPICAGDMCASDLRGGAGLILAGLKIKGESNVFGARFLDRGYENIEDTFCSLGGYIIRKKG